MHILFLTDNFPPEVNAPASRTFEHAREWTRAGHEVTIITCAPNFPTGRVFDGYRNRLWQTETMDGVRVIRVWTYITANEGLVRRSLDYASFMTSAVMASPFVRQPDVVVGTSPQLFTACAAYTASRLKRVPFMFELRDLWPESIRAVGAVRHQGVIDRLERLELFLYRKAATIVSVTHSFRENLASRGIDPAKIEVVTNGVDLTRFEPGARDADLARELGFEGKTVAGYVGTHGLAQGLETILDAAAILRSAGRDDVRFMLLGDGAEKQALREMAASRELTNVTFIDTVPKADVTRYLSLLDVALIHLRRNELFRTVIPSKLFECMASGIPVLHGVEGESARILTESRAGMLFRPEGPKDLAQKLLELVDDPALRESFGAAGRKAAERFDRTVLARRMLEHIERTVFETRNNSLQGGR